MAFRVGQKVVCVNDAPHPIFGSSGLRNGSVYTVAGITVPDAYGTHGLFLAEIKRDDPYDGGGRWGYDYRRFRPVVERKTDITIFTAMLSRSPNLADVGP